MNRRQDGTRGEAAVAEYLRDKGYVIRTCNYLCHTGEIDIIAEHKEVLVFVEVKARRNQNYGRPCEAVTPAKLKRIERTALWYMSANRLHDRNARIDVVELWWESSGMRIEHLENVTG